MALPCTVTSRKVTQSCSVSNIIDDSKKFFLTTELGYGVVVDISKWTLVLKAKWCDGPTIVMDDEQGKFVLDVAPELVGKIIEIMYNGGRYCAIPVSAAKGIEQLAAP